MGGHVHLHAAAEYALLLELREEPLQGVRIPRHDRRARSIADCYAEARLVSLQALFRLLPRQLDEDHRAAAAQTAEDPTPAADDLGRVFEAQDAREVGGCCLSHAVANDLVRGDSPRPPQRPERDFHREEERLHHVDLRHP